MEALIATLSDVPELVTIRDFLQDRKRLTSKSLRKLWSLTQDRCERLDAHLVVVRLCSYAWAPKRDRLPVSKLRRWLPTESFSAMDYETWDADIVEHILAGLSRVAIDLANDFKQAGETEREQLLRDGEYLLNIVGLGTMCGLEFPSYGYEVADDISDAYICILHHMVACATLAAKTSDIGFCVESFHAAIVSGAESYPALPSFYWMMATVLIDLLPQYYETLSHFISLYHTECYCSHDEGDSQTSD